MDSKNVTSKTGNNRKLRRKTLHSQYFNERLQSKLARVNSFPLTIVEAPLGFGKTVAIRSIMSGRGVRVLWINVTTSNVHSFWYDFCTRFAQQFPPYQDLASSLLSLGLPEDQVQMFEALKLMRQLEFTSPTYFVIDDYHLLNNHALNSFIELVVKEEIEHLHIIIVTRHSFMGNQELLELKGYLLLIKQDNFALSEADIVEYFRRCGADIGPEEGTSLHKNTGGWISGLYLYLMRYLKDGKQTLASAPTTIHELITKQLYAQLEPDGQEFLDAICPYQNFTYAQADFLCALENTNEIIKTLLASNAFIIYDEKNELYMIHTVFHNYLTERFRKLPAAAQNAIYKRHGDWFARIGAHTQAIEAYYYGGHFELALQCIESDMDRSMVTEKAIFFVEFFAACPEELKARYLKAGLKYAIAAFSAGNFELFKVQCAYLQERLSEMNKDDPWANELRGELEFLYSLMAYNDIKGMSIHHRRALEFLGHPLRSFAANSPWTLGSPSVLYMFHRHAGMLEEEIALMKECLPFYYRLANQHGAGGEYLLEAESYLNTGDYDTASIIAQRAEADARRYSQTGNVIGAMFVYMRLHIMDGEIDKAQQTLINMRALITNSKEFFLLHTIDLCAGFLYALIDCPQHIPGWLTTGDIGASRLYAFAYGFYYIVYGRILLLTGEYHKAVGLMESLLSSGRLQNNLLFTIYAQIYIAGAYSRLGNHEAALTSIKQVLDLIETDRLYMPLVENYEYIATPLENVTDRDLTSVHELALSWQKHKKKMKSIFPGNRLELLTKREHEIINLAMTGKNNREIAEVLYVTGNTIKRAMWVIYGKLGINSREELLRIMSS